jgi:hypothetical protein
MGLHEPCMEEATAEPPAGEHWSYFPGRLSPWGRACPGLVGGKARTAGGMSCQVSTTIRVPRSFSGS